VTRRWTISAARSYLACPQQYYLTRVANTPRDVGSGNARGILLHAGLAAGYSAQDECHQRGLGGQRLRAYRDSAVMDAIDAEVARLGVEDDPTDEPVDTVIAALDRLGPYPDDEVLGVERDLQIEHRGVPISMRVDVLYRRRGMLTVRDWKSTSELPRARDLPFDRQLALGALCAARIFGETEVWIEIASINAGVAVICPIRPEQARAAGDAVAATSREAEADTEFVARPGSACASCPVWRSCPVQGRAA
jgi:hypothetical protein